MKVWLLSMLGGAAMVPVAIVIGIAVAYGILSLRGVSEYEGKRGFLAMFYGGIPGAPLGFYIGHTIAQRCLSDNAAATSHRVILAALMALLVMSVAFIPSLIGGVRWTERHARNHGGKQAAWSLFYFALPITLVLGAIIFFVTWRTIN